MAALNPPIHDWAGKYVWVVGASSGIGKALAEKLSGSGASVIATARRADALGDLSPAPWLTVAADIGNADSLAAAITQIRASAPRIDVVFWVAGVYHPMVSTALDLNAVRETFEVNVLSGYRGLALVLEDWLKNPAPGQHHWVWVSSVAGYRGLPKAAAYGASKAAMTYLAETNYLELKAHGIGVSVVCPGFVQSRLTAKNEFQMPALITPKEAADMTLKGMAKGAFEIDYPKRFTLFMKLLSLLPYRLYFAITQKAVSK
jgi:NAD(P)-dependent dehydrogenase (short-subunit alcohol dehydrogenase family)